MKTINAEALQKMLEEQIRVSCVLLGSDKELLFSMLNSAFQEAPVEKWRPTLGETYWLIGEAFTPTNKKYESTKQDRERFEAGNCFQTQYLCQEAIEKIKKALAE